MMRKILSLFAIVSMLVATSCSNEEFDSVKNGTEANVSFTAQLPEGLQTKMTRTYGDGTTAENLTYAVYDENWNLLDQLGGEKTFNLQTTVNLTLVNGKTYNIVFWADSYGSEATDAAITFNQAKAEVEVNYNKITANSEALDAFFYVEKDYKVTGAGTKNVTLKRPFAQLNIGTADWEEAAKSVTITKTGVKVTGIYNTLDLKDESVSGGENEEVTFKLAKLPGDEEVFPAGAEYKYLSMNYLLVGQDQSLVDVTIMYDKESDVPDKKIDANVPVQRNWRTNIYGKLLTSQTEVNVSIDQEFGDEDINVPIPIAEVSSLEELNEVINTGLTKVLLTKTISINSDIEIIPENELTIYTDGKIMFNVASSVKLTLKNVILDGENKGNLSSDNTIVKGSIAKISDYGTRELYEIPLIKCKGDLTLENVKFSNYYGESGSYGYEMINIAGTESESYVIIKDVEVSNNIGKLMVAENADITVENLIVQNNWLYGNKAGLIEVKDNAKMTFKSGNITNNLMTVRSVGLFLANNGKIIIENGIFTNNYSGTNGSSSICSLFGVEGAGKLTVNAGTFEDNEGYRASVFSSRWCTATDAQIIINGGTYKNNSNRNTDFGESVDLFLRSNAMISKEATFTGDVVIDSGILDNEGVISGDVTIKSGSLTGSGTVTGTTYSTETEK